MERVETVMDSDDVMTVTLKRVHLDRETLQGNDSHTTMNAYHESSMQHLQLDNSIDLDQLNFEDDLEDILLDDTMMNEMHEKRDWQEACCTFLRNIMTPKKGANLESSGGSPIANLFLRREEHQ